MESKVEWVERLCDEVEGLDPSFFDTEWRKVSIPASVAAIRVCYYVGESSYSINLTYEKLYYMLVKDRDRWDALNTDEQKALLNRMGVHSVMVFIQS